MDFLETYLKENLNFLFTHECVIFLNELNCENVRKSN